MKSIWEDCNGRNHITKIDTLAWRCVEEQARSSTRKIVSTVVEHEILEEMLEETKPKLSTDLEQLHYLLFTPFRYPPLKHGSRFGSRDERNLFYAALDLKTALAEKAYYRLALMKSYQSTNRSLNYTAFQIRVFTKQGIDLCSAPFNEYKDSVSSPTSYDTSRTLGLAMRNESIEAFLYFSARTRIQFLSKNIGLFCPEALINKNNLDIEKSFINWHCYATQEVIEFSQKFSSPTIKEIFYIEDFFVNGEFPDIISA